jgi:hypothetical protein
MTKYLHISSYTRKPFPSYISLYSIYEENVLFFFYQCIVNREVLESSLTASEDGISSTSSSTSVLTIKPKREDDGEQFLCQVTKRDCLSRS